MSLEESVKQLPPKLMSLGKATRNFNLVLIFYLQIVLLLS